MLLYTIGIYFYGLAVRVASLFNHKAAQWVRGRRNIYKELSAAFTSEDKVVWVHCASLGEFEQGRPVIERIGKEYPQYKILLTFFSPSGYNIRRDYEGADAVFYLPLDTPRNARRFLDAVKPDIAIFVKYEFWLNYLDQLDKRKIKTYLISAIFRPESVFFRPYGGLFRKALGAFSAIFVQNETSKDLLAGIGVGDVLVSGDTRFDRVAAIPDSAPAVPVAEKFAGNSAVLIAGSTWQADEELLLGFLAGKPHLKVILAPHEIEGSRINELVERAPHGAIRYSACTGQTDFVGINILIVDTIGLLSSLYRYGKYAYIGGGFGVGIHNTLEAATFGLPLAFGPNYRKFREARQLIELGAASSVQDVTQLEQWYSGLESNPVDYAAAKAKALSYIAANKGATDTIVEMIFSSLL